MSGSGRVAGVTVPLFSIRTRRSWGIGEIGDLPGFAAFAGRAGVRLVQLLPLGEISGNDASPYSAMSAFAIDPMYISLSDLPDLPSGALEVALGPAGLDALERARAAARVDYGLVRRLKTLALRAAFERFHEREISGRSERARQLERFVEAERHWLPDFALFRAIKDALGGAAWFQWPAPLAERRPDALAAARALLDRDILRVVYTQWLARTQWALARRAMERARTEIMGDLPFMVGRDSADVWSNRREFVADASVGAPPDAFDADGQDWDLPPYRWEAMRDNGFAWLKRRASSTGELFHRFRVDHAVGFYRTYSRPEARRTDARGKLLPGKFDPPDEAAQLAHGERVYRAMIEGAAEHGASLIAEDLGVVPDFVRASLAKLAVPGYRVLIWEKDGPLFRDPKTYPERSVACFGTHDTPPVRAWWAGLDEAERRELARVLPAASRALDARFTPEAHAALLDLLSGAASELVLFQVQDLLGAEDRVNTPGTVGPHNWTYRLPNAIEDLEADAGVAALLERVRGSVLAASR